MTCSANGKTRHMCVCRASAGVAAARRLPPSKREYGGADVKYDSGENVLKRIVCHRDRSALSTFNGAADYPIRENPDAGGSAGVAWLPMGGMGIRVKRGDA